MEFLFIELNFILFFAILFNSTNGIIVNTTLGPVKGNEIRFMNKTFHEFLGIRFAEPPVGSLRFAKPKPIKPWTEVLDATKIRNTCMQNPNTYTAGEFSEDCLFLNVRSPERNDSTLKPVMFWIYGGGLIAGSIYRIEPLGIALGLNDVVLVEANYRLGFFGFLYGDDESAPGNVAFHDQILALKWVKDNIKAFGGDPDMVTIFGESAGSFSVGTLIISPLAKNLFRRAIMQSGSPLYYTGKGAKTKSDSLESAKKLAQSVGCQINDKWLDCLRKVDAHKIQNQLIDAYANNFDNLHIEGDELIPYSTQTAFKNGHFNKEIDIIIGINKNEGSNIVSNFDHDKNYTKSELKDNIPVQLKNYGIDIESVYKFYLEKLDEENQKLLKLTFFNMIGDFSLLCPAYFFAKDFATNSNNGSVYFYELTYRSNHPAYDCDPEWLGVCHADDMPFVFGFPLSSDPDYYTKEDYNFSLTVMKMWTNFVKTGKPLPIHTDEGLEPHHVNISWSAFREPQSDVVLPLVMELHPKNLGNMFKEPYKQNCDQLWKQYFS